MTKRFSEVKHHTGGTAEWSSRQNWGLIIGVAVVLLGIFILLINLSGRSVAPNPSSTPIVVRDGLIVTGSGPELYIFKKYTLHQIIDPTLAQQTEAQLVADSFLARYAHGSPVDQDGLPMPRTTDGQLSKATSPVAVANLPLRWLGGGIILVGGICLLVYLFRRFQPDDLPHLETHLQQAATYSAQIEKILQASSNRQPQQLLAQIYRWRQAIEELVQNIARLRRNDLIQRDLAGVPAIIADLKQQLDAQSDPTLHAHLGHTLAQRESQLAALKQLQISIEQAEIQVETTVAILGTIYSQLLTSQSTSQVFDYGHLLDRANEEMHCLQDHLEALREVKGVLKTSSIQS